jgi:UrcA family protein
MKQFAKSVLVILATTVAPALAQPDASEHITVPSPNIVQKTNVGPTHTRTITVSQAVSYGDLDLRTGEGMTKLQGRVKQAAADVCRELDRRYPKPAYTGETVHDDCVGTATRQAMARVEGVAPLAPRNVAQVQASTTPRRG